MKKKHIIIGNDFAGIERAKKVDEKYVDGTLIDKISHPFQPLFFAQTLNLREYSSCFILLFMLFAQTVSACPACEKQQPEITKGLTHGTGPQSNWDWVIIAAITSITIVTFIFSLKYLIKPKEKDTNHIKRLILNS